MRAFIDVLTTVVYQGQLQAANEFVVNGNKKRVWSNHETKKGENPASQGSRIQSDRGIPE